MPGVLTRTKAVRAKKKSRRAPTVTDSQNQLHDTKNNAPGERPIALDDPARRVACRRAHGATGGATQEGRLQGRAAPFRGRTAPEAGEVVAPRLDCRV